MIWKFERSPEAVARLRRVIKRTDKNWTVRLKYNVVCVMRRPQHRDVKSEAQLECRERFRIVNERVAKEFKDVKRQSYWRTQARKHGYKTARGYARAVFMRELIEQEQKAAECAKVTTDNVEQTLKEVLFTMPTNIISADGVSLDMLECQSANDGSACVATLRAESEAGEVLQGDIAPPE